MRVSWEQILAELNSARDAARSFRRQRDDLAAQAQRVSDQAVRDANARGDLGPQHERDAVAGQGRFELLSPEALSAHVATLRQATVAKVAEHQAAADRLRGEMVERSGRILAATAEPSGAEGLAVRVEQADARSRVRSLLDAGTSPDAILRRAATLGDRTMLRALRDEVNWLTPDADDDLPGAIARRLGVDTEGEPDPLAQLQRRIDDAELATLTGREHDAFADHMHARWDWPIVREQLTQTAQQVDTGPSLADAVLERITVGVTSPTTEEAA